MSVPSIVFPVSGGVLIILTCTRERRRTAKEAAQSDGDEDFQWTPLAATL